MYSYITALYFAIPLFIILIIVEMLVAYKKGVKINRAADMISSLSSGITNTTRDGIKFGFLIISYTWLVDQITIITLNPVWLAILIAFITEDFAGYWVHRLNHRVNIFWNRHIIHHSSEEFNLSCALRQSISNNIKFSAIFMIPAALLGIPPVLFAIIGPIHLFLQFWYHTQLINTMGWLEKIIVTPSHHRVHHAINPEYIDKNYSQIFIIWDKLFGTFQQEINSVKPIYGTLKPANTWNPIIINFRHIIQLLKDAYYTENYFDKLKIWFMPTGWRPNDVEKKHPITTIVDPYKRVKFDTNNSKLLLGWSWFQLTFTGWMMLYMFSLISSLDQLSIVLFAGFLILQVSTYTALLDKQDYVIILEIFKCISGVLITYYIQIETEIISRFIIKSFYTYLFISLGMMFYFNKKEKNSISTITINQN